MKLIDIIRFIRGYVRFTVKGGFTERFINLCSINRIHIWNLDPGIGTVEGSVLVRNFKKLRPAVRKSGVNLRIKNKTGLPFLIKKHKSRIFLLIGTAFFFAFIFIMNQFVWFIEVTGTNTVSHEEILTVLGRYGLHTGAYVNTLDEISVSRNGVNHFNGRLRWMAINIKGSKAVVEVRDFIDEHEDTTFKEPCNIVADFEGKILSIEAYNGDIEAKAGNAVKIGDLLISGVIQNRDMSADYLEARGKITALHTVVFNKNYNLKGIEKHRIVEAKQGNKLKILGCTIPLYYGNNENSFSASFEEYMTYKNVRLPFGIEKEVRYDNNTCAETETNYLFALDSYVADFYYCFRNTNILEYNIILESNNDTVTFESKLECIDYMGKKSLIYVENEKNY